MATYLACQGDCAGKSTRIQFVVHSRSNCRGCGERGVSGRIGLKICSKGNRLMSDEQKSTWRTKVGLAEMLKGGVIMDVVTPEQAIIAEEAGAVAVMALERVPADIRRDGGVARMSDPD